MDQGAVPLIVRGLKLADSPTERVHALRCLLNFAWAGPAAVKQLREEADAVKAAKAIADDEINGDDAETEARDAARGLLQVLGETVVVSAHRGGSDDSRAEGTTSQEVGRLDGGDGSGEMIDDEQGKQQYGVFLSHKQTDAQDFARSLYTLFESRGINCFLDMEYRDDLNDFEVIVSRSRTLLFVLSDNVLESEWCLKELAAAVRHNVKIVMVVKEGSRWPDKNGNYTCTFPPDPLIQNLPVEVQPAFKVKAIEHVNSYYKAFVAELLNKIDAQQAEIDALRGRVDAVAAATTASTSSSAGGGALAEARAALRKHLEGVHPGLVEYLDALHELGIDAVDDLRELDEATIDDDLKVKKFHRSKLLTACGR